MKGESTHPENYYEQVKNEYIKGNVCATCSNKLRAVSYLEVCFPVGSLVYKLPLVADALRVGLVF